MGGSAIITGWTYTVRDHGCGIAVQCGVTPPQRPLDDGLSVSLSLEGLSTVRHPMSAWRVVAHRHRYSAYSCSTVLPLHVLPLQCKELPYSSIMQRALTLRTQGVIGHMARGEFPGRCTMTTRVARRWVSDYNRVSKNKPKAPTAPNQTAVVSTTHTHTVRVYAAGWFTHGSGAYTLFCAAYHTRGDMRPSAQSVT